MKKFIIPLSIAFTAIICTSFSACSTQSGNAAQSETASDISSFTSSVMSDAESTVDSYIVKSDYKEWTYKDWSAASDEQKENCRAFFSEQLSKDVTIENLGKIFGTNQDKNLSEIIKIQKEAMDESSKNSSDGSSQSDPGHGAAAGYE